MQSIFDQLEARSPNIKITPAIITINVVVFLALLYQGAGFWHSPNGVQLAWGANFAPATQDGQWWRLGSAMFLHFGVLHLLLNSYALWDAGQLAERMYGVWRLILIYVTSGLFGNLLSLVTQGNQAVSGGASGAIFGLYAAVLVFLWRERDYINPKEFKWLFGGGLAFAIFTVILGYVIPGIDNAAHIGGFVAGSLASTAFSKPINARKMPFHFSAGAYTLILLASIVLLKNLPAPKYKWSEELMVRAVIGEFATENQEINRNWLIINHESQKGEHSFEELASKIDFGIAKPYEESFEKLSSLPNDPNLPSAKQLESLLQFTEAKKLEAEALVKQLKKMSQQNQITPTNKAKDTK